MCWRLKCPFILLSLHYTFVLMLRHQKPVPNTLWNERCKKNSFVLNDCNWCSCDQNHKYNCKARVCQDVDMFGHFKDTIENINVGMEGHGSWRTTPSPCVPGVQYRRGATLCVCNEDGNWPSPICRDIFRVLYPVEVTDQTNKTEIHSCTPRKLYLDGCNVCFCPQSGEIDPELCTTKTCSDDDPVVTASEVNNTEIIELEEHEIKDDDLEIYATCTPNEEYSIGCKSCVCFRNNRLHCDNCTTQSRSSLFSNKFSSSKKAKHPSKSHQSYCDERKPNKQFYIDCNLCHCDVERFIHCTAKKCLTKHQTDKLKRQLFPPTKIPFKLVGAPIEDQKCTPGTRYKKDCNTCFCLMRKGIRVYACTLKICNIKFHSMKLHHDINHMNDCAIGTAYELNCQLCHCYVKNGVKTEICEVNRLCAGNNLLVQVKSHALSSLHGYCEPLHMYKKECNTCHCMTDGKTLICTSNKCAVRSKSDAISVEILPLKQKGVCPRGFSFKLDCNTCFCLFNGNVICTVADCSRVLKLE